MDCLETTWISSAGKYVERFEEAFAEVAGTKHAITCSNGTAALHLALLALGVKPGDEVIVPTLTFVACANSVVYCGAKPVLVDVDRKSGASMRPRSRHRSRKEPVGLLPSIFAGIRPTWTRSWRSRAGTGCS